MNAQDKFGKENPQLQPAPREAGSSSSNPGSDEVTYAHRENYHNHAEHGPPIDNALRYDEAEEDYQHHKDLWWSRIRHELRDPFMEFCGTMIMIIFGDGSVAQGMNSRILRACSDQASAIVRQPTSTEVVSEQGRISVDILGVRKPQPLH